MKEEDNLSVEPEGSKLPPPPKWQEGLHTSLGLDVSHVLNPLEHSVVSDATGLAMSAQYTVVCETVETSMSFACNSSFLSVDGMTCLISSER